MSKIHTLIDKVYKKQSLTVDDSIYIFDQIMNGNISDILISSFLTALKLKGENIDEIYGAAISLRNKSKKIHSSDNTIDTAGTGGDKLGTLNISTAAALVSASAGVKIAKHGNRSVSSKSGSADVLEKMGIKIDFEIDKIEKILKEKNFCFMFAPLFHTAMKHVGPVRKELGTRTIFNLLGPLLNPANTKKQLLGVYDKELVSIHAQILKKLESEHILVVHGFDGLDEISLSTNSYVAELKDKKIKEYIFNPEEIGYSYINLDKIKGGDATFNAKEIMKMLNNENINFQKIVEINSGATIYLSGLAKNIKEGTIIAKKHIDEGKSKQYVNSLIEYSKL